MDRKRKRREGLEGTNKPENEKKWGGTNLLEGEEVRGRFRVDSIEQRTNRSKTEQRKMNETFKCSQLFFYSLTNTDE